MLLRILKRNFGYSMAELMIALGIATVVIGGVSHLIVTFNQEVKAVTEMMDFDEESFRLQYFFSLPFRTAVNLKPVTTDINTYVIPASSAANAFEGRLRVFDSKNAANNNTITTTLAVFARDASQLVVGGGDSKFTGVGIYFQQPSPTTFGVLYMSNGNGTTITPNRSGNFITNLTRVAIENVETTNGLVRSFMVRVWMRYPTSASTVAVRWCPAANACSAGGPAKDIERFFTINLANNIDLSAIANQQLPLGRIYFLGRGNL